jgi:hypothetical protein
MPGLALLNSLDVDDRIKARHVWWANIMLEDLYERGLPSSPFTASAGALPGRNHDRLDGLADLVVRNRVSSHKAAQGMVS